jgi:hypothetical protein
MEIKNSFRDHLAKSSQIVREWPAWKQSPVSRERSTTVEANRPSAPTCAEVSEQNHPRCTTEFSS